MSVQLSNNYYSMLNVYRYLKLLYSVRFKIIADCIVVKNPTHIKYVLICIRQFNQKT